VEGMYSEIPNQCSECGLRKHNLDAHKDWHFKMRSIGNQAGRGVSRKWFRSSKDWLVPPVELEPQEVKEEIGEQEEVKIQPSSLPADDEQPCCVVCNEKFEQKWDDESEGWLFLDCHKVGENIPEGCFEDATVEALHLGKILHFSCYESLVEDSANLRKQKADKARAAAEQAAAATQVIHAEQEATGDAEKQEQPETDQSLTEKDDENHQGGSFQNAES